jgi:hypothetical protein
MIGRTVIATGVGAAVLLGGAGAALPADSGSSPSAAASSVGRCCVG